MYDLKKDPNAYYNINYKVDKEKINYLMIPLKERYEKIKKETNEFVLNLKNSKIEELR